jgi:undecaprenyl-diphosphatase
LENQNYKQNGFPIKEEYMESLQLLLLSVVQAATEFLPISSSGHLLFLKGIFHLEDIPILFDVLLHVGSLTAIVFYYRRQLAHTLMGSVSELKTRPVEKPETKFLLFAILSTLVTFVIFLAFEDPIESAFSSPSVLACTYMATTVILLSTWLMRGRPTHPISLDGWRLPILVGLFQGLAILPGVSRSGSTIAILLLLNIKRDEAAYYSFFLAIPAILGGMVFEMMDIEALAYLSSHAPIMIASFLLSAGFSYLFLSLLSLVIRKEKFWVFSFYTFGMAIAALIIF